MAQVNVTINGRQYRMGVKTGQEEHVTALAQEIDDRIEQLRGAHGEIGDQRLTVMAALTVADESCRIRAAHPASRRGDRRPAGCAGNFRRSCTAGTGRHRRRAQHGGRADRRDHAADQSVGEQRTGRGAGMRLSFRVRRLCPRPGTTISLIQLAECGGSHTTLPERGCGVRRRSSSPGALRS